MLDTNDMDDELIEKVAAAICVRRGVEPYSSFKLPSTGLVSHNWEAFADDARAAIQAVREWDAEVRKIGGEIVRNLEVAKTSGTTTFYSDGAPRTKITGVSRT